MCRPVDFPPYWVDASEPDPDGAPPCPSCGGGAAHWPECPDTGASARRVAHAARTAGRPRRVLYTEPEDVPPPEWRDPADVYRDREA